MILKQRLEHRQKTIFTQSLQQSVKILELPLLELKEAIEAELIENPVIEEVSKDSAVSEQEAPLPDDESYRSDKEISPDELGSYEKPLAGRKESLADILMRQLRINARDEHDIKIGFFIIHRIDENGYLREGIDALCQQAGCPQDDLLNVLKLIQTFEPTGVGSRDLKECLMIQLKKSGEWNGLVSALVENHLEDLAGKDIGKLCKKLKCTQEALLDSIKKIQGLEPKPGRSFINEDVVYVIIDATVEEKDNVLSISTKDDFVPAIRINPTYRSMLKSKKINEETKTFIRQRMSNANNFIRAIRQRQHTLFNVVAMIAETQAKAMLEGMDQLKPLTLKDIAEPLKMHESTISRVVMNKHIQTPQGIFALKDFFSNCLKTQEGEDVSSQRIKLKIQEFIDQEDKHQPLRDQKIAELLRESERIAIARRTVAKYREMLNIPSVAKRRSNGLLVSAH